MASSEAAKGEARVAEMAAFVDKVQYTMEVAESLPELESFVEEQVRDQLYHLETNLAVLKIYQYHPELVKIPVVMHILLKALMALPSAHFSLCAFQLSKAILRDPQVGLSCSVAQSLLFHLSRIHFLLPSIARSSSDFYLSSCDRSHRCSLERSFALLLPL
jgi:hypothetical protein